MKNIAILGFGTVGSGVADVLAASCNKICREIHDVINVKYILDLRDFPESKYADRVVHDFDIILNDPEVELVCETMGGTKVAFDYTLRALNAGKSVVTSNKEVVAAYGKLLCDVAREKGVRYLYEASVGGGIPIIRTMKTSLGANDIYGIDGILNGTTNYILTHMKEDGVSFEEALAQAQKNGYAELNPKADVDGDDACRKICILAALAFGAMIPQSLVSCDGISNVTLDTIEKAEKFGGSIKLIASARRMKGEKVDISVAPCVVAHDNPLAGVSDVFNAVMLHAQHLGDVMMYGKGAGKLPTASAVVSDIIEAIKAGKGSEQETWNIADPGMLSDNYKISDTYCIYVPTSFAASEEKVLALFGKARLIFSEESGFGFIVENISRSKIRKNLHSIDVKDFSVFRYIK